MKYCVTGLLNTGISYIFYAVLVAVHLAPSAALAVGYLAGMATSFIINTRWTFQKSILSWRYLWRFILVNVSMLLISEIFLRVLRSWFPSPYLAQALNLIPITLLGYLGNRAFVYADREDAPLAQ